MILRANSCQCSCVQTASCHVHGPAAISPEHDCFRVSTADRTAASRESLGSGHALSLCVARCCSTGGAAPLHAQPSPRSPSRRRPLGDGLRWCQGRAMRARSAKWACLARQELLMDLLGRRDRARCAKRSKASDSAKRAAAAAERSGRLWRAARARRPVPARRRAVVSAAATVAVRRSGPVCRGA